jgi:hypothetical protein
MVKSLPHADYDDLMIVLGELFEELSTYIIFQEKGEVLASTSAVKRIEEVAENNFALFEKAKQLSENNQKCWNTTKTDCTIKAPKGIGEELSFSISPNAFTTIFKAYKEGRYKSTQMRIVQSIVLSLGYMGWDGYKQRLNKIPNKEQLKVRKKEERKIHKLDKKQAEINDQLSGIKTINDLILGNKNLIAEILLSRSDYKEVTDNLVNKVREKNITKATSNSDIFLIRLFNDILEKSISNSITLQQDIELVLGFEQHKLKFNWYHRAIIASFLSLSFLRSWDDKALKYLEKLTKTKNEPIVSERAIIGITIALLVSFNNGTHENFEKVKKIIEGDYRIKMGVFSSINFFITNWKEAIDPIEILITVVDEKKKHQCFTPLNSKPNYGEIAESNFNTISEKDDFFLLLNYSFSLSPVEKRKVVRSLNRITETQYKSVLSILVSEVLLYEELNTNELLIYQTNRQINELEDFKMELKLNVILEKYYIELNKSFVAFDNKDFNNSILNLYSNYKHYRTEDIETNKEIINLYNRILKKNKKNVLIIQQILKHAIKIAHYENNLESYQFAHKTCKDYLTIMPNDYIINYITGQCELILCNKEEAMINYKKSIDLRDYPKEFFKNFDDDYHYVEPHGISEKEYEKIKVELQKYCEEKK